MRYSDFIKDTLSYKTGIIWNYYGAPITVQNLISPEESRGFIRQYFETGEKGLPLVLNPMDANAFIHATFRAGCKENILAWSSDFGENTALPDDRAIHTVSGFFWGLLIENCLNGYDFLKLLAPLDLPFSYLWFLTFLYHDYGYCVAEKENAPIQVPPCAPVPNVMDLRYVRGAQRAEYIELSRMKRRLGINLSLYSPCWWYGRNNCPSNRSRPVNRERELLCNLTRRSFNMLRGPGLQFNSGAEICSHRYTSTTTVRYFNYCINEWKQIDHGIVGGFLFYDRMVKNYLSAYAAVNGDFECLDNGLSINDFHYRYRHFCVEQLPVFLYIAGCISAHNMWKQQEDQRTAYERHLLDDLLSENYRNIAYEENPLLYILVITDTLEPLKVYRSFPSEQVINAICAEYVPGSHKVTFSSNSKDIPLELLYEKAKGLENWTSVVCSEMRDDGFSIFI